jgi:arogenate dehydrogenase (NADP+), plant
MPPELLRGKLIVDVSPVNGHPKEVMLRTFQNFPDIDILCTNPMFGPSTGSRNTDDTGGLDGRSMVYEKVRVNNVPRCDKFLGIFEQARCNLVEMDSAQHDATTADAEFVTHLVGRLLDQKLLPPTPVMSPEYEDLCNLADMTAEDSFDLFFGMYKYNPRAREHLATMRENLANIERQLAGREAYLGAKAEMKQSDRQRLLAETRLLLQELAKSGGLEQVLEAEKEAIAQKTLGEATTTSDEQ